MLRVVFVHPKSHCRLDGTIVEIADVLSRPEEFPNWWGDVYLSVKIVAYGNARGIGKTVAVRSKGWLPYPVRWQRKLVASNAPHDWRVQATGDLNGEGQWTLTQNGPVAEVSYDWRVTTDRLLFRLLAPVLRRFMVSNHAWAMAKAEAGLRVELARRSGQSGLPSIR